MLIEIVQHEANKVVKEATLEQALEYAHNFPVNLVDSEGNRTPFVPADHVQTASEEFAEEAPADEVEQPADEAQAEAQAESVAEAAPAPAAKKAARKKAA